MNRTRLLMLAAAAGAAILVVVLVVVFAGGGSNGSAATTTETTAATTSGGSGQTEAVATFAGVPQRGDTLGKATAPATMIVFEDPQCPYCKQWNIDTLPTVVERYVRTGRLKVVYRGIRVISDNSYAGIAAAYAAGRQNKLWQMVEAIYERQGDEGSNWITVPLIRQAAKEIKLDPAVVVKDANSAAVVAATKKSAEEAQSYGINGTPTFAIQKTLGPVQQLQVTSLEPDGFTQALDAALQ